MSTLARLHEQHRGTLVHRDLDTGRVFRTECACGWTSSWRTTNACDGDHHRHVAQLRRRLGVTA